MLVQLLACCALIFSLLARVVMNHIFDVELSLADFGS